MSADVAGRAPDRSPMQIREVTLADPALLAEWHAVYSRGEMLGRESATPWTLPEITAALERPDPTWGRARLAGVVDGRVVASAALQWPLLDNLQLVMIGLWVDPPVRRRGHGTRMLAVLEERCRELGRSVLIAEVGWPYELGPVGQGSPGTAFADVHGYALALGDVHRRLDLPVEAELLDALEAEAAPRLEGYRLRGFVGPVPEDLVEAYAVLDSALSTEAPTGDLPLEPMTPDLDAVRAQNDLLVAQRRTRCATFAFRGEEPAAYSEITVVGHEPGRAYQWGTLVRRAHRGHRLGMAVKVANLRMLQREFPQVDHVLTWNAESNDHMVAINEALGFSPVGRMGEFQKRLKE